MAIALKIIAFLTSRVGMYALVAVIDELLLRRSHGVEGKLIV